MSYECSECERGSVDIQNRLRLALEVNSWLNEWKETAEDLLKDIARTT
jgi:hypothetical protein